MQIVLDSARLMTHVGTMTGQKAVRVALYSRVRTRAKITSQIRSNRIVPSREYFARGEAE